MDNQKNRSGPRTPREKVKKFFVGVRKKIRAKLQKPKVDQPQNQQRGGTTDRPHMEEQKGRISTQGSSAINIVESSEREVGKKNVHLEMTPSVSAEISQRFYQRKRAKKFLSYVEELRAQKKGSEAQKQQRGCPSGPINMEEPTNTPKSSHKKAKKKVRFQSPPAVIVEERENLEFQSAPFYQTERAKTFLKNVELTRAKFAQEAFHQLEEPQCRDSVVKTEQPESTTVSVDDSMWARVKSRMSNFPSISEFAHRILEYRFFSWLSFFLTVLNTLLLGFQAVNSGKPDPYTVNREFSAINWTIVAVFLLEVLLKMMEDFRQFWRSRWNIVDFCLTLLVVLREIIMMFARAHPNALASTKVLLTLRVLRSLKIMSKFVQLLKVDVITGAGRQTEKEGEAPASASSTSQKQTDVDWETKVLANMGQEEGEEVVLPREEMFAYLEKIEQLQQILEERKQLHNLLVAQQGLHNS